MSIAEKLIGYGQCDFRNSRRFVNQVFNLKKSQNRRKRFHVYFLNLAKAFCRVQREKLWRILKGYMG